MGEDTSAIAPPDSEDDGLDSLPKEWRAKEGQPDPRDRGPTSDVRYCKGIEDVESFVSLFKRHPSCVDVMELFGGEAGVLRLSVRRGLRSGGNIDLVTHWNLLNPRHVKEFEKLHKKLKPEVLIMAMPCTGFSVLQYCFAKTHPEAFARALAEGTQLACVAGCAAIRQMSWKKHFVAENPADSRLWQLSLWRRILALAKVQFVDLDQCAFGLKRPDGLFVRKKAKWSHPRLKS